MRNQRLVLYLALAAVPLSTVVRAGGQFGVTHPTQLHDATALKPPAGASVALIEFADLECPDCARANPLLKEAAAKFGIPWVRHDFPLPFHNWSMDAAINARWFDTKSTKLGNEYRDAVFAAQASIFSPNTLQDFTKKFALAHGIAMPSEIDPGERLAGLVKADFALGQRIGIEHVPAIWVATANSKGAPFVEVVDRSKLYQLVDQANADAGKRPMTFEDMMKMKRLGETAVSPDGKWLAYSVTTVDLEQNTKTAQLWLQRIAPSSGTGGEPIKLAAAVPGDSGPQFSPDGKRILFLSSRDGGHQQVFMVDFDPATGATSNQKRVTFIWSEADNAQWAPDGKSIVFTSEVYPDCPAIRIDDFATGDGCNIDRDEALEKSKVKAQIFTHLLYRHWNHFTGDKRSHLMQVMVDVPEDNTNYWVRDLTPNDPHDVPPFSLEGGGGFAISPDSKELAFTENRDAEPAISTSASILTLDLTNPSAKPVKVSTSAGGNFNPAYSPDGKWLAWRSQARAGYESDKFRLALFDRQQRSLDYPLDSAIVFEPGPKPAKFDRWVDEFSWRDDSKLIYFTSGYDGEAPVQSISLEPIPRDAELALHEAVISPRQPSPSISERRPVHRQLSRYGKMRGEWSGVQGILVNRRFRLIGTLMRVDMPSEVVLADPLEIDDSSRTMIVALDGSQPTKEVTQQEYDPTKVTHLNDDLFAQLDLQKMEDFWFTAKDGVKVQGFVIRPPGFDAAKKYPVKVLIHGGPQGAWGDSWSYRWNAELFAANGYVVIMINPRGSTGYGQAFVDGVNGDWGGKPFTDLMTGLDYAEEHYPFIDKTRECALGASYGGYMANWILGHTNRFKCIVSHDGMFDAESAFGSTEEDWFNIWEFKGHPWDYYGKPDSENPFRKWSPSLSAKNFKTPTLVVHSQLDYRLDVSEGFQLFDTLQLLKVPSKMLYFPDEGHWVMKPQNSELWYKTVNDWVDEWTKVRE